MLLLWTGAKSELADSTLGLALKRMRPEVPSHEFVPWLEGSGKVPSPGKDDVLLACGLGPYGDLQRAGYAPKNRALGSIRESLLRIGDGHGFATYAPGLVNSEPDKQALIEWDLRLATRWMKNRSLEPEIGDYKYVGTLKPLINYIKEQYEITGQPVTVAGDMEGMGFYPWYPEKDIISVQFTAKAGTAHVLYVGPQKLPVELEHDPDFTLLDQVAWILTSPIVRLVGCNFKFDLGWIRVKWGIVCTNFVADLFLAASLLDENRLNGLSTLAKILTPMGGYDLHFNKHYDKSHMENVPPGEDFLTYAGGDSDATYRSWVPVRRELLELPRLGNFYITILHPGARAFENIEHRGIHVSLQRFHQLRSDVSKAIDSGHQRALEILPQRLRIKYRDKIETQLARGQSPFLPSLLKEYFFGPLGLNLKPKIRTDKTDEPSTSKAHLRMFGDTPEAKEMVDALTEADVAAKTRSTFIDGFLKHLRPDGLLHPTYFLGHGEFDESADDESGTVTGRLSAKNPAIQIIPKKTYWGKRIRECFIAPPGKQILQPDYIQGELKVVACIADERNMLKAYEEGLDLHAVTGANLRGVPYEEFVSWKGMEVTESKLFKLYKDIRDRAKAGNFGLLYGICVEGFIAYAWATYSLALSYEQADEIRTTFFKLYPALPTYHEKQKRLVKQFEEVWSPLGRRRLLKTIRAWDRKISSKAERRAINSPVQSTLTDMLIWALALIEAAYPNEEIASFMMTHDAFGAYVDEDKVELRAKQVAEIMENLPFDEVEWEPQLKFTVEADAGYDMGNMVAVHI
jgi:DNA polymerase I-like protein with 3'-5' exonuclease and polymerase domains